MGFFVFLIVLKIAITVAFVMGTAWIMAEYLPVLATKIIHLSNGTWADFIGEWAAKVMRVMAKYAGKFLNVCFEWLDFLGVEFKKYNDEMGDKAEDAAQASSF